MIILVFHLTLMQIENKIDWLNIGLVIISLGLAIYLPFKLFLFSYAVLGPLHYLTEINWLKDKRFFIKRDLNWLWPMLSISALISLYPVMYYMQWDFNSSGGWVKTLAENSGFLLVLAFLFSFVLVFVESKRNRLMSIPVLILLTFILNQYLSDQFIFIAVFLPTLFHVYLFTLFFVWYGAIKSRSTAAYLNVLILGLIPLVIAFLQFDQDSLEVGSEASKTYVASNMASINVHLAKWFGHTEGETFFLLSNLGMKIQVFIAFAYTYHYLNWFSKTNIIGWKKSLTNRRMWGIALIWISAILIYIYDYQLGFISLFFLSYLHVLLEFPLNIISIRGIFS